MRISDRFPGPGYQCLHGNAALTTSSCRIVVVGLRRQTGCHRLRACTTSATLTVMGEQILRQASLLVADTHEAAATIDRAGRTLAVRASAMQTRSHTLSTLLADLQARAAVQCQAVCDAGGELAAAAPTAVATSTTPSPTHGKADAGSSPADGDGPVALIASVSSGRGGAVAAAVSKLRSPTSPASPSVQALMQTFGSGSSGGRTPTLSSPTGKAGSPLSHVHVVHSGVGSGMSTPVQAPSSPSASPSPSPSHAGTSLAPVLADLSRRITQTILPMLPAEQTVLVAR